MTRRAAPLLGLFLSACANSPPESGFAEDAGPAPVEAMETGTFGASDAAKSDGAAPGSTCQRDIEFGATMVSNPSCYTNESVANAKGSITYPCSVGGTISVMFGTQTFTGTISGSQIKLTNVELFVFPPERDPACRWQSTQVIEGDLDKGPLSYRYSEAIATPGKCTSTPCQTTGTLSVTKVGKEVVLPK
jgi:hypothetical protein